MRTALVTGSEGFIGRHMVAELRDRGYVTSGCDLAAGGGDARRLFQRATARYDLVVHCAYHVGGRQGIEGQPANLILNAELDAGLFSWAHRTRPYAVLYFSSSAAYPVDLQTAARGGRRLAEGDIAAEYPQVPDARYGLAKLHGEHLAAAARVGGVNVHVVRPFSGYSGRQSRDYPFPSFIDRARQRRDPFPVWGSGDQVRDWIHVSDVVAGSLAVVDAGVEEPVNLCTGTGTSMRQLAHAAAEAVGYSPQVLPVPGTPEGVFSRVGDPSLFHSIYQPKVDLAEGIRRALARED